MWKLCRSASVNLIASKAALTEYLDQQRHYRGPFGDAEGELERLGLPSSLSRKTVDTMPSR